MAENMRQFRVRHPRQVDRVLVTKRVIWIPADRHSLQPSVDIRGRRLSSIQTHQRRVSRVRHDTQHELKRSDAGLSYSLASQRLALVRRSLLAPAALFSRL